MNVSSLWQDNKHLIVLVVTAISLLIMSFMLDFVRIGLIVAGVGIIVYVVVSVVRKIRKTGKQQDK